MQSPKALYVKRCSQKFHKIHRKTPVLESLFLMKLQASKVRLWHRCFPVNFVKFQRTPFYRTPLDDCFLKFQHEVKKNHILLRHGYRFQQFLLKNERLQWYYINAVAVSERGKVILISVAPDYCLRYLNNKKIRWLFSNPCVTKIA